uniref:(northern house mosquito) hypothetical protein n=1 Tax=Culex pipiens TaxID=7175 RepID=A0A8D8I0C9_CULPI
MRAVLHRPGRTLFVSPRRRSVPAARRVHLRLVPLQKQPQRPSDDERRPCPSLVLSARPDHQEGPAAGNFVRNPGLSGGSNFRAVGAELARSGCEKCRRFDSVEHCRAVRRSGVPEVERGANCAHRDASELSEDGLR